jgi:integrase
MLSMFYGTGMRLDEMCNLKMSCIDAENAQVKVVKGKGNKDRMTILPKKLLEDLRCYYKKERPKVYLFEGKTPGRGISNSAMQSAVRKALVNAGFPKGRYSAHSLRHSGVYPDDDRGHSLTRCGGRFTYHQRIAWAFKN